MKRFTKPTRASLIRDAHAGSGFTLIEALATLMLIAIVLPVVMRGIAMGAATAGATQRKLEAATLAETKLAKLIINRDYQFDQRDGDFEEERMPGYQWTATVDNFNSEYLKHIRVKVKWMRKNSERSIAVSTLIYSQEG